MSGSGKGGDSLDPKVRCAAAYLGGNSTTLQLFKDAALVSAKTPFERAGGASRCACSGRAQPDVRQARRGRRIEALRRHSRGRAVDEYVWPPAAQACAYIGMLHDPPGSPQCAATDLLINTPMGTAQWVPAQAGLAIPNAFTISQSAGGGRRPTEPPLAI